MVVHPLLKVLWLVVANWTASAASGQRCLGLRGPMAVLTPIAKGGEGMPVPLPPISTILGEPIPTTKVVDSIMILVITLAAVVTSEIYERKFSSPPSGV